MKKIWTKIACATLALLTLVSTASCTEVVSAYDIAVKNGFVGTEQEWLKSLHGADGKDGKDMKVNDVYEWAKEQGFDGTYMQFLQALNLDVVEDNDLTTIAKNLTSVVDVYCGFTQTVTRPSGWTTTSTTYVQASAGSGVVYSINRNAGTALIITNYHVIYSNGITETGAGVDTANGISDCIYIYPYGELNAFSSGDERVDGVLTAEDTDDVQDSEQGDVQGHGIKARFIGGAMQYDIALLETEISEEYFGEEGFCTSAEFGDSNAVTVGEKVFAMGNSNGEGISVTSGVLSVESEYIDMKNLDGTAGTTRFRVMRTDSAINPGNSGGALFNAKGELIGINNAKNINETTDNMGYCLPITQVKYVVENALSNRASGGYVLAGKLGIEYTISSASASLNADGKLIITERLTVSSTQISPTASAYGKLAYGDIVKGITLHGKKHDILRNFHLVDLLLTVRKGDTIVLHIVRDGANKDVGITFDKDAYFVKYA